ncbi:unnamed protein product, partial [Musa hybrid cultivar]
LVSNRCGLPLIFPSLWILTRVRVFFRHDCLRAYVPLRDGGREDEGCR